MSRFLKVVTGRRERPATPSIVLTEAAVARAGASKPVAADAAGEQTGRAEQSLASIQRLLQANRELAPLAFDQLMCQITALRLKLRQIAGDHATD